MGNMSRPGTVVIDEIAHAPFEINGEQYFVNELVWNGISGRSFDLARRRNGVVEDLSGDESFDEYPTGAQIAIVLEEHGIDADLIRTSLALATGKPQVSPPAAGVSPGEGNETTLNG